MKKTVSTLIILMFSILVIQSCRDDDEQPFQEVMDVVFEGNLIFDNQNDFQTFIDNEYTKVVGNVTILDDVTSLVPLLTLHTIEGNVIIMDTALLTLDGLENLERVTGSIDITSNLNQGMPIQNITDFCALQNLFITGNFGLVTIQDNGFNPTVQDIINGNCTQ